MLSLRPTNVQIDKLNRLSHRISNAFFVTIYLLLSGLFIPIGMFPNSEQLSGLPNMAAVAEMMQKQKPDESMPSTEDTEGAPTENIKEVRLEPCKFTIFTIGHSIHFSKEC